MTLHSAAPTAVLTIGVRAFVRAFPVVQRLFTAAAKHSSGMQSQTARPDLFFSFPWYLVCQSQSSLPQVRMDAVRY